MTPPVFTARKSEALLLHVLCVDCAAMDVVDDATGRCRPCWRAWRWSPVGWPFERQLAEDDMLVTRIVGALCEVSVDDARAVLTIVDEYLTEGGRGGT